MNEREMPTISDVLCPDCGHPERHHGPTGTPPQGCWAGACATRVKGSGGTKCPRGRPFMGAGQKGVPA